MPTSKTKQPSPLRRGFKADAERIALEYRQLLGLKKHDPLPAQQLADHLHVRILVPSEIPGITLDVLDPLLIKGKDCWSAAIYLRNEKKYIIHNPTHAPCRQESNLMHELAHAHCNHPIGDLETAVAACMLPLRKIDDEHEAEAECLGACLQLPKEALFHYHNILKKTTAEISRMFNACKPMVEFRLRMSGVLKIGSWK